MVDSEMGFDVVLGFFNDGLASVRIETVALRSRLDDEANGIRNENGIEEDGHLKQVGWGQAV